MEFGKTSLYAQIDYRFPAAKPLYFPNQRRPQLFLGLPIWQCKEWLGDLYPRGTKPTEFLKLYSQNFQCVELNSTHYVLPERQQLLRWRESVSPGFRFCPKVLKGISHNRDLQRTYGLLSRFMDSMLDLAPQIGPSFLQLPPSFSWQDFSQLKTLLSYKPRPLRLALEFRHRDWFISHRLRPEVFDWMQEQDLTSVITDVAGRRDVLHFSLPTPHVLIRFIGNDHPDSDHFRLEQWGQQIEDWMQSGVEEIYFFIHTPDNTHAPQLATEWLNRWSNASVEVTPTLIPVQESPQLTLF